MVFWQYSSSHFYRRHCGTSSRALPSASLPLGLAILPLLFPDYWCTLQLQLTEFTFCFTYWSATHLWKSCSIASTLEYFNEFSNSSFLNILFLLGCGCVSSSESNVSVWYLLLVYWTVATSPVLWRSSLGAVCLAVCLNGFELTGADSNFYLFPVFIYRIGIRL